MESEPVLMPGDPNTNVAFAARGWARGRPFEVGISRILAQDQPREQLEARALAHARRVAETAGRRGFDWEAHGFLWNERRGLWGLYFDSHNVKELAEP